MKQFFLVLALVTFALAQANAQLQVVIPVFSPTSCNGLANGTATAFATEGTPPYFYQWPDAQTTSMALNLSAGVWCVTVTDALNETATACVTITEPPVLFVTSTVQNPTCSGGADGEIITTTSGGTPPYQYQWSNGMTTADVTGLSAGAYEVLVADANTYILWQKDTLRQQGWGVEQ